MRIGINKAAQMLLEKQDILILVHEYPDGDTLGSGFALCRALHRLGKRARVQCSDDMPDKYSYIWKGVPDQQFEPRFIVAVDIADKPLIGKALSHYADKVELCIDHHISNTLYAKNVLLDKTAAATAEIIYRLIGKMGVTIDAPIANCLYTGIATDTGCFQFSNTTAKTHLIAAKLIKAGADIEHINRLMFETKSLARMEIEKFALNNIEYYLGGRCAIIYISRQMIEDTHAGEGDLEGLSPLPLRIEGVSAGITIREKGPGLYKVSLRTDSLINASQVCSLFGGGGHPRASGCTIQGSLQAVKKALLEAVENALDGKL